VAVEETGMVPLAAAIITEQSSGDGRTAVRRSLRLDVSAYAADHVTRALVLNISETGILVEADLDLQVGETLHVDMPEAGASPVRVIWKEKLLVGCEFVHPVSTGAVSAAQLMSRIEALEGSGQDPASAGDRPSESRFRPTVEGAETAVLIVAALIAMMSLFIFIAAIVTLR
jgi:hypothetical protein